MTPSISNTFTQSSNSMQLLLPAPQFLLVFHPLSNHNQSIKTNYQKNGITELPSTVFVVVIKRIDFIE